MITGAQGGHPDTAACAKCSIIIAPSPGKNTGRLHRCHDSDDAWESVDVVVTDLGIAINPARQDLIDCMKDVDLP